MILFICQPSLLRSKYLTFLKRRFETVMVFFISRNIGVFKRFNNNNKSSDFGRRLRFVRLNRKGLYFEKSSINPRNV